MKHAWAWVTWLVAVLVIVSITRNPLYLLMTLGCVVFVGVCLRERKTFAPQPFSLWKFAGFIILLATGFNALTSHYGETILFTIPGKIPLISGNVTLEAMVYGAINGLILVAMLASFSVLNLALPVRDQISLIPRAFFPVAVVTSIAVTYLPTTLRQFKQIREAQEVRGHQMRSLGDWLPLLMPLLIGGLEHAMQLAEAMTARGFGSGGAETGRRSIYIRVPLLVGVLLLIAGWLVELGLAPGDGLILVLAGVALILLGLWLFGRNARRTAYHQQKLNWQDGLVILGALVVLAVFL
ncbi:MAG: energy-coupling factor transporter transmembrane component T, partial [Acidobacteriaceae bacterium]